MKTKMSKKSAITVTILASLLAVAVATTIVLAAFSANRTATTTIKFSNGVELRITGATLQSGEPDAGKTDTYSTEAPLFWNVTVGSTPNNTGHVGDTPGTELNGDENVSLAAISIDVKGTANTNVYLAVKPNVSWTKGTSVATPQAVEVTPNASAGWTAGEIDAVDGKQWYLKTISMTSDEETDIVFSDVQQLFTNNTSDPAANNQYAGRSYTAIIVFEASTVPVHQASP